jgi:hypothetical protein
MRRNPVAALAWVVGLCLLVAGVSQAAVRTFTWVHPTTNSDGSALPLSQITRTTLVWGASETAMTSSKVVTGNATTTTLDLAPGTWYVAAKVTANGNDSPNSNVVQLVIAQPVPNPPTLSVVPVVAGINMSPAYKMLADGTRSQVIAGFVPVGTACDDGPVVFKYRNRSYRRISAAKVQWWNPPLADVRSPPAVAAPCA